MQIFGVSIEDLAAFITAVGVISTFVAWVFKGLVVMPLKSAIDSLTTTVDILREEVKKQYADIDDELQEHDLKITKLDLEVTHLKNDIRKDDSNE